MNSYIIQSLQIGFKPNVKLCLLVLDSGILYLVFDVWQPYTTHPVTIRTSSKPNLACSGKPALAMVQDRMSSGESKDAPFGLPLHQALSSLLSTLRPRRTMTFDSLRLHNTIISGIRSAGYEEPTPIQAQAIPVVMEGRDLIALAQTGTGKTAAFALPIMERLITGERGHVRAAIISPTRELAEQTCQAFKDLGVDTGLRSVAVYGGVSLDQQTSALRRGAEIVVGCPGRMLDLLWRGTLDFTHLEIVVIDEADRMLDMGFLPSVRDVLQCILQSRQTLLFSATMPDAIRKLAQEFLKHPVTVKIGRTMPAATVTHSLYSVSEQMKTPLLKRLLKTTETRSVLVFTRTKFRAQKVTDQLRESGFRAASLRGDMTQPQRQAAFDGFRDGTFKILVATDIAARGIDVLSISHVINYDMPDDTDSYIHRIGRTGRIEHEGQAFTFVTSRDERAVGDLERLLHTTIERRAVEGFSNTSASSGIGPTPHPRRRGFSSRKTHAPAHR